MISAYSIATAVILYNAVLIVVWLLCRNRVFMAKCGTQVLLLITVLGIIRLFTPVDNGFALIVQSDRAIPAIQSVLRYVPVTTLSLNAGQFLLIAWGLGSLFYAARIIVSLFNDHKIRLCYPTVYIERVETVAQKLAIKYPVIISPRVPTPYVAGIFKPTIYLPPLELSEKDWQYILWHELQHLRSNDLPIKLFYFTLAAVFWWNPVSHMFVGELDALLELRCDANLARRISERERTEYLEAILKVAKQISSPTKSKFVAHSGLFGPEDDILHRFNFVLKYDEKKFRLIRALSCITAVVMFSLSYFIIFQPIYYPPTEDMDAVHAVTENSAFILYDGVNYSFYIDNNFIEYIPEELLDDDPYVYLPVYEGEQK